MPDASSSELYSRNLLSFTGIFFFFFFFFFLFFFFFFFFFLVILRSVQQFTSAVSFRVYGLISSESLSAKSRFRGKRKNYSKTRGVFLMDFLI